MVIVALILICIGIIWCHVRCNMTLIAAPSGKKYRVCKASQSKMTTSASLLGELDEFQSNITECLVQKYTNHLGVRRLIAAGLSELEERSPRCYKEKAYNVNKGQRIGLCLDGNMSTLRHVLMHEMAHTMTLTHGHTSEFWENLHFLEQAAVRCVLHEPVVIHEYCGVKTK